MKGESTYEYYFKILSWYKFRVPREKLEFYYSSGWYLEGFNFNNLVKMLIGLTPILARKRLVYIATSNWKCFIQKVLTLKKWLIEEVMFYIRDLQKNRVKVYITSIF